MKPRAALACLALAACGHNAQSGGVDDANPDADDSPDAPLHLVRVEPADNVWLHEPIRFVYNKPPEVADATATLDGAVIPATTTLDGNALVVRLNATGVGMLHVSIGNAVFDTEIKPWSVIDHAGDIALASDGTVVFDRQAASRDEQGRLLTAWIDNGVHVARDGVELPSPGSGSLVRLDGATVAVFGATAQVRTLVADAWQPVLDAPISGTVLDAAIAPNAVAWVDSAGAHVVRDGAAMPVIGGASHVALARRGNVLAVAWDEAGWSSNVVVATANGNAWSRVGRMLDVDPISDAVTPALALDSANNPVVAWQERIDGKDRGVIARWSGSAWTVVGSSMYGAGRPVLALRDDAPIVATPYGVSRFNGAPKTPPFKRASIAGCNFDPANPSPTLMATGCIGHPGLVPYGLIDPLWTDGTKKRRWIALPDGQSMTQSANGSWSAPVGTRIFKEFAIETTPGNPATRKPVETRVLANTPSGWMGFSYRWRADGSDADLLVDGAFTYDWTLDDGSTYRHAYPSRSQCLSCHHTSFGPLLGIRPQQLTRWFDYDGTIAEQMPTLASIGIGPMSNVTPYPSTHDRAQTWETRMRAYMASNCAHCHNPGNIAIKDLRFTTPLAQTRLCEVIEPGYPTYSVVYQKVTSRPGMPALGSLIVDPLADNLLYRWIAGMTSCP